MGAEDVNSLRNNLGKVTKKLAMDKSEEQKKFEWAEVRVTAFAKAEKMVEAMALVRSDCEGVA